MIVIVDHGMGKFGSVQNMFRKLGAEVTRSADPNQIADASKLVLAGIGHTTVPLPVCTSSGSSKC